MFEFILRRTIFKDLSKEDQDTAMLLKQKIKMELISDFLIYLFGVMPLLTLFILLLTSEHTLSNVVQCVILISAYSIFVIYFVKRFNKPIKIFKRLITASMYFSRYVLKGNAIKKDDFEIIKKENEKIHYGMMTQQVRGYCYSVCFEILKCLKKGTIEFVAVRSLTSEKNEHKKEYTIHVLYVNDWWCYDTFSERQYPLEEVMKRMNAKTYASFTYKDVEEKTYEEFRNEHAPALKEWCEANDCYEKWSKY